MHPREKAVDAFQKQFGKEPRFLAIAPGRVNLLGEHVDYNDGFVLPAAIDRATYLAFSPSEDNCNHILAADFNEQADYSQFTLGDKCDLDGNPLRDWVYYPAGVAWALEDAGLEAKPIVGAYSSNIPRGSGLSSSASVLVSFAVAYQQISGWNIEPMALAKLGQKAENQYVGVNCGIMDQFASACGVENHLLLLDCRSLEWQTVPLSDQLAIVVADTSVRRKLTSGEYNKRREACEEAVAVLKHHLPKINSLRDVDVFEFEKFKSYLPDTPRKRAEHVVYEIERGKSAPALLGNGDFDGFGRLMEQCHASLRDLYEVSCPELDLMTELAKDLQGYIGARLTGAGFGGCTVNLVHAQVANQFAQQLAQRYNQKSGLTAEIYVCKASRGASVENL